VPVDPQVKQAHEQTIGSSAGADSEPNRLASAAVSARPSRSSSAVTSSVEQHGPAGAHSCSGPLDALLTRQSAHGANERCDLPPGGNRFSV
jgi:hypothetical protein